MPLDGQTDSTQNAGQSGQAAGAANGGASTSAASASGASNVGAGDQGQGQGQQAGQGQGQGSQSAGNQQGQGQNTQAGATSGAQSFTYKEDRSNWIPPHRARSMAQRYQQVAGEVEHLKRQIAALTGVQVPNRDDQDPETRAIREQFNRLYPGLAKLEQMADKLAKFGELDPQQLTAAGDQTWVMHGYRTLNTLMGEAAKAIGGELSPSAQRMLKAAFGAWLEGDEELQYRYAMGDDQIVADFLKEYRGGILDPYRRTSTTQTAQSVQRTRNLPRQGGGGNLAGTGATTANRPKPGDANYEDAIHDAGWSAFQAGA